MVSVDIAEVVFFKYPFVFISPPEPRSKAALLGLDHSSVEEK